MANKNNADIISDLYEAVNRKDLEYIRDLGAPNSEWREVPFNLTLSGSNAIIDPWVAWFKIFPDASCEVQQLTALGEYVIAQGIGRGTHRGPFDSPVGRLEPSGATMETNFCDVYKLENGKIIRADSYFDFFGILKQLAPQKIEMK